MHMFLNFVKNVMAVCLKLAVSCAVFRNLKTTGSVFWLILIIDGAIFNTNINRLGKDNTNTVLNIALNHFKIVMLQMDIKCIIFKKYRFLISF